jgi:hypothetical protein
MFGTYQRLRLHVSASNVEVIRAARLKVALRSRRNPEAREARKAFYRLMLAYHHKAQAVARDWCLV